MKRFAYFCMLSGVLAAGSVRAQAPTDADERMLQSHHLPTDAQGIRATLAKGSLKQPDVIAAAARVLARRDPAIAGAVLIDFLPAIRAEPFLEGELLAIIGGVTFQGDQPTPFILTALKDGRAHRRAAAAFLLARRGSLQQRAELRRLLDDSDALVRQRVSDGLVGKALGQAILDAASADEALLRGHKIEPTDARLYEFFQKRTLSEDQLEHYRGLIRNLDSRYAIRENATRALIKEGPPVLGLLKEAPRGKDLEKTRRVQYCIDEIRAKADPAIPIAAAHRLMTAQPKYAAEVIRTLLAYLPFADDEAVEDQVLGALTLLSLRTSTLEPALVAALTEMQAARRAAAAYVLGQVATQDVVAKVKPLLNDPQPVVRLRAAQGLLAARDRTALPTLVKLVDALPAPYLPRLEETLQRLAEDKGPTEFLAADREARVKAAKAWGQWLADHEKSLDLASLRERDAYLGLVTICEYDAGNNNINGKVWETSRSGAVRASFSGVTGAMDAQTLPNGRVLVAENNMNRVTERDAKGAVQWEYRTGVNPISCQRLPNGNTFIASYNTVMEITPSKTEVYRYTPGPQFFIFSAHKAKNGNIVAITAQGRIVELDSKTGREVHNVQTNTLGNWCSVELQPNGNYLVASMSTNSVREVDRKTGQEVWTRPFPGAFRATRLPNGNVVVASMTTKEVAEFDRAGSKRWSTTCNGRPWSVHWR